MAALGYEPCTEPTMQAALGSFYSPKHQLEALDVPLQWLKPLYRPRTKPSVSAQLHWDWPRDLYREDRLPISSLNTAVPSSSPTLSSPRDISSPLWSGWGSHAKNPSWGQQESCWTLTFRITQGKPTPTQLWKMKLSNPAPLFPLHPSSQGGQLPCSLR